MMFALWLAVTFARPVRLGPVEGEPDDPFAPELRRCP